MTYPVGVVNVSEAKALLEVEDELTNLIYPTAWSENIQTERFKLRKRETEKALESAVAFRKQKEKTLREIEQILEKLSDLLSEYPHEKYAAFKRRKRPA